MDNNQQLQTQGKNIAKNIDTAVNELITQSKELGAFERALKKADIISMISDALDSSGSMASIMKMQGKQFGFKTDSQLAEGYPQETVKNCLIEATIRGVEPTGNMFNILGGNCYITKEGCTHILNRMNIPFRIMPSLSKMLPDGITCVVPCIIIWFKKPVSGKYCINESTGEHKHQIDIPVVLRKNKEGGIITKEDARTGMAKRDAMAWLIEELTGTPMPIGSTEEVTVDAVHTEIKSTIIESKQENQDSKPHATPDQQEKFDKFIAKAQSKESAVKRAKQICDNNGTGVELDYYDLTKYNSLLETLPENAPTAS